MPLRPPPRSPSPRAALLGAVAAATLLGGLLGPAPGSAAVPPAGGAPATDPGCGTPLLEAPVRAAQARRTSPRAFARAVAATDGSPAAPDLDRLAADRTVWLDRCGAPFYVEPARTDLAVGPAPSTSTAPGAGAVAPLEDTFTLESLPGSSHTVYLDFTGGTVSGTAWNASDGEPIVVEPYDDDAAVDTAFSDAELVDVQGAWAVVAADFAALDVNVTTRWPGQAAITRSGAADPTWGSHVRITDGGPIFDECWCGGVAYLDVIDLGSSHAYYQPAWVFADGTGHTGKRIGEAASHEVGHQLGLEHDGTTTQGYYAGAAPWAPVMGAGYYQPVTQWSRDEYPGANNAQDDVGTMVGIAGAPADDHAGTPGAATPLAPGQVLPGRITSRADTDAFTFTAAGRTTLSLRLPAFSDLDASLRVLDETGAEVALVDPPVAKVDGERATGMDATWTATLPVSGRVRTVVVDGVGHGVPGTPGAYSDYGSLGTYTVALTTSEPTSEPTAEPPGPPAPLSLTGGTAPTGVRSRPYSSRPVVVDGGTAPYRWTATGLPDGLTILPGTGEVRGTPTGTGSASVVVEVTDDAGADATTTVALAVVHPPTTASGAVLDAVVGRALSTRLRAAGGDDVDYRWRLATSAALPTGLSLDPDGTLAGVPTSPGTSRSALAVTSGGSTAVTTLELRVTAPALAIATPVTGLPTARVGRRYRGVARTTGAQGAVTWQRLHGRLPRGLRWRPGAGAGMVVEGRALVVARTGLVLRVTDEAGRSARRRFVVRAVR